MMELSQANQWKKWAIQQKSGGWGYHYLAHRYGRRLWLPFKKNLSAALTQWRPITKQLVLVGPSGGYCIDSEFLKSFHSITAIEVDKSASYFFRRQHPGIRTSWLFRDYFFQNNGHWNHQGPAQMIEDFPYHCFLFCNLLGQLTRHREAPGFALWKEAFRSHFEHRPYFSYHDLLSSSTDGLWPTKTQVPGGAHNTILNQIQQDFSNRSRPRSLNGDPAAVTIIDHLTHDLFLPRPRTWIPWSLSPRQFHLIELIQNDLDDFPTI